MTNKQMTKMFLSGQSIREIASAANVSRQVVRRVLIEAGLFESEISNQISRLAADGKSPDEIANMLEISRSAVNSYLPYSKGRYKTDAPTENALRIRKTRERKTDKEV